MKKPLIRILIVLFSIGWILPAWLSLRSYYSFWQYQVWPLVSEQQHYILHSFPYLRFFYQTLSIACIWFAAVIGFWAWRFSGDRNSGDVRRDLAVGQAYDPSRSDAMKEKWRAP